MNSKCTVLVAFADTRVALHVGAVWLGLLVRAHRFWVKGNGRRRADLVDETSPLPVVTTPVSAGS